MKIVISCLQNHGKEDGIYPLKEIAKHKTKIRDYCNSMHQYL